MTKTQPSKPRAQLRGSLERKRKRVDREMLCVPCGSGERPLPVKFSPGRIGRARLRRAAEVCVCPRWATEVAPSQLLWSAPLALIPVAAVYDRRHHGLAADRGGCTEFAGVAVATADGRTFGFGMGPDGIGSGVGVPCNFASRNLFRCCAS